MSYLFMGPNGRDLVGALEPLGETSCVRTILVKGGGIINGAFLEGGPINGVSLLVSPIINDLAGVPTIFEYYGVPEERPAADKALQHLHTRTLEGGAVRLCYCVEVVQNGSYVR